MTWVRFVDIEVPAGRRRSRRRVVSGYILEPRATARGGAAQAQALQGGLLS